MMPPVVLSIAGSDSGGGAGLQADLKTFSALQTFGTTALTCVRAQNPEGVQAIHPLDPSIVVSQIESISESFPIAAAKTGMLYSADIIRAVAKEDIREGIPVLVVDPVMMAASGDRLLQADAIDALCNDLLPIARVVTPNLHEAEILCGHSISSPDEMMAAATEIGERFDIACVIKGGQLSGGSELVDVMFDEGESYTFTSPRINALESHGAGSAFSAALTAFMARKELLHDAVAHAQEYVRGALEFAHTIGKHRPLNFFWEVHEPAVM